MPNSTFNIWDEEGLHFEQEPADFVLLDRSPVVWTVRGIRYFRPRFAQVGIPLSRIRSRAAFEQALGVWLDREWQLLTEKISQRAMDADAQVHRFLLAIAQGDTALARELADELTKSQRIGD
jgi:hypothetical protein